MAPQDSPANSTQIPRYCLSALFRLHQPYEGLYAVIGCVMVPLCNKTVTAWCQDLVEWFAEHGIYAVDERADVKLDPNERLEY